MYILFLLLTKKQPAVDSRILITL